MTDSTEVLAFNWNHPWEYSDLWDNETQFLNWIRSQIRQIWMDYPVRIEFKDSQCTFVPKGDPLRVRYNLHGSTKWIAQCVFCSGWFPKSKLEVDHIIGEVPLTCMEHIPVYVNHQICPAQNMQLTCKPCHKVKTYSERYNVSFEDAQLEKIVIAWLAEHNANMQKGLLIKAGFSDDDVRNAGNRRKAARELLRVPT